MTTGPQWLPLPPSIDDDDPHFQPPDDHDEDGHPHPQLSPTMTSPNHNVSTPACQQYFFFFFFDFYYLPFPYFSTAQRLSPASPSDLNVDSNDYEENDSPKQEDAVLLVSVRVITSSHHPSSITTRLITREAPPGGDRNLA